MENLGSVAAFTQLYAAPTQFHALRVVDASINTMLAPNAGQF
jgi:hypothetical protein